MTSVEMNNARILVLAVAMAVPPACGTSPAALEDLLEGGILLREGQGRADHNAPWTWHMDPIDIEMADATIEVCDGRPSLVDSLLDDYLTVGRFCPWGAELVGVQDFR